MQIIVPPDAPLIRAGPYRLLRHPNHAVVIGEIAALPFALGLPIYALVFSILNDLMLSVWIRADNATFSTSARRR
jgi:methyltransferase